MRLVMRTTIIRVMSIVCMALIAAVFGMAHVADKAAERAGRSMAK